jgi:hypothetical protein
VFLAAIQENAWAARAESLKCGAKDSLPFAAGSGPGRNVNRGGVWGESLQRLYRLDREADEHFECTVENLKDVITGQATIFALGPLAGGYNDAAITSAALGTDNIGFPHRESMGRLPGFFQ